MTAREVHPKRRTLHETRQLHKTIIGRSMRSRASAGQRVELQLACRVLNTMTRFGMPDSYRVA